VAVVFVSSAAPAAQPNAAAEATPCNLFIVKRRVVSNGRRSEWLLQECTCGLPAWPHVRDGWACARCSVRSVARDQLSGLLQQNLGIDLDRPESFVVQQSTSLNIAQKPPLELLHFLEAFCGTESLRARVEAESASAAEQRAGLEVVDQRLAEARSQRRVHEGSMAALEALESFRQRLERSKAALLWREAAALVAQADAQEAQVRARQAELASAAEASQAAETRAKELATQRKADDAAHKQAEKEIARARSDHAGASDALVTHGAASAITNPRTPTEPPCTTNEPRLILGRRSSRASGRPR
jgi:chromosome segregation ATPase